MKAFKPISTMVLIGLTKLELMGFGALRGVSAETLDDEAPDRCKASLDAGVSMLFLDTRTPGEWQEGVIEGALMIELNQLPNRQGLAKLRVDRNTIIGVYCKAKHRSTLALSLLHQLGYQNAIDMEGGMTAWPAAPATPC